MSGPVRTERLAVIARPRLSVDGREEPRLSTDLVSLEATQDDLGMATLELVLVNLDAREAGEAPGYTWYDGQVLDLGRSIEVRAGDEDNDAVIFAGVVTAMMGRNSMTRPPELVVRAEDALQWLRMRQRTRIFREKRDGQVAEEIARDHGLQADATADGPSHEELWQVGQSDLAFLRERARAVDARLDLRDGTLRFVPRHGDDSDPAIALSPQSELVSVEVGADLAHQRTRVRVHGWSVDDGEAIHEEASDADVDGEDSGGRTGARILHDAGIDAIEDLHLEVPVDRDEARRLARAELSRRARRFVVARGTTAGTPALRVGRRVELLDLGPWFDGTYRVCAVRHRFDQVEGLRTWFEAERADVGGGT